MSKKLISRIGADKIIDVCKSAKTFKEACEQLNCGYRYLVSAAIELGVFDELKQRSQYFSHRNTIVDKPWRVKSKTGHGFIAYVTDDKIWCDELFKGNITANAVRIKKHLIAAGYKNDICECCGVSEWNGKPISLQLYHIDGNPKNNSLENLQILCPNCHTQTDNYGSKNARNKERGMTSSSEDSGL